MDTSDLSHHILSRYNEDLERVRTGVLQMGGFVEQQLKQAVMALVRRRQPARRAGGPGDHKVNAMEVASTTTAAASSRPATRRPPTCA
jgi:phosphate transport system protein